MSTSWLELYQAPPVVPDNIKIVQACCDIIVKVYTHYSTLHILSRTLLTAWWVNIPTDQTALGKMFQFTCTEAWCNKWFIVGGFIGMPVMCLTIKLNHNVLKHRLIID